MVVHITQETTHIRLAPLQFRGRLLFYASHWWPGVFLSVLSLGIYSPWLTVKSRDALFRQLYLNESCLSFQADPLQLLFVRLVLVGGALLSLGIAGSYPAAGITLLGLGVLIVLPWLGNLLAAFRLSGTRYRGIRFRFQGHYPRAIIAYVLFPIVSLLTLGLLAPFCARNLHLYLCQCTWFGRVPVTMEADLTAYISVYLMVLPVIYLTLGAAWMSLNFLDLSAWIAAGVVAAGSICALALHDTLMTNLTLNALIIGSNSLVSNLRYRAMLFIYATNAVLILLSAGLFWPIARTRLLAYKSSCIDLCSYEDFDQFLLSAAV